MYLFRFRCGYFLEGVFIGMAGNTGTDYFLPLPREGANRFLLSTASGGKGNYYK